MNKNKILRNILIANRGLPAMKFIMSIKEWALTNHIDIKLWGIITDLDLISNYKYIDNLDYHIFSENTNVFMDINEIVTICLDNKIESVWPGWGYLSEESNFSKALEDNNIIFIGPSPNSLKLLGDKIECMTLADKLNIPQLAWSKKECFDIKDIKFHSENIGLPVILKSSNGGGGKGIRPLFKIEDLEETIKQIKNESSGGIFVMKLAENCKHIEIQIVSDGEKVIALGSRDCSLQRRRQKLVEEAPASFVPDNILKIMEDSAIKIVNNVGLKGLCTAEFLLEKQKDNYIVSFMEINPRLQVEHIVTETIFNLNLPSIQVMLASGFKIDEINELENPKIKGHAISVRINSEDPYENFKPCTGLISDIKFNCLRNCWGYFSTNNNSQINSSVDNQFGHLVAWSENRDNTRIKMKRFLQDLNINSDMPNTANFLKGIMTNQVFIQEMHNVNWLESISHLRDFDNIEILSSVIIRAFKSYLSDLKLKEELIKNGHLDIDRYLDFKYYLESTKDNNLYGLTIHFIKDNSDTIIIEQSDNKYELKYRYLNQKIYLFIKNKIHTLDIHNIDEAETKFNLSGQNKVIINPSNPNELKSSFSGKVNSLLFNSGDYVAENTTVLTLEIMKMIIEINTTVSGKIYYQISENQLIEKNDLLFKIESDKNTPQFIKSILNLDYLDIYQNNQNQLDTYVISRNQNNMSKLDRKRFLAKNAGTTYIYDMIENFDYLIKKEMILTDDEELEFVSRPIGENNLSMIAFDIILNNQIRFVLIANDITVNVGSFSWKDDLLYYNASKYARINNLPRIYISANSGAKLELNNKIKSLFKIKWKNNDINQGFDFLYLDKSDYKLNKNDVKCKKIKIDDLTYYKIKGIKSNGVKNLNGSALIASETSRCFEEIFTLTYVTGRSIGIGAYLTKLGIRTIQKNGSPILLTGAQALNKVLGKKLYIDNNEIGGTGIMNINSTSHVTVDSDIEGIHKIEKWLSYFQISKYNFKEINYIPKDSNYDINKMIETFFDDNSIFELFNSWGKSILSGKARLGGMPVTYLVCNNQTSNYNIPVDPGDITSKQITKYSAGNILTPDASQKVAQIIKESRIEKLPLIFLVNLRGFSGGTGDMLNQILTHGSNIVRELSVYDKPVYIYVMPHSQLRGGAMVVISKMINSKYIKIYADPTSNINILEPSALQEIKFKKKDVIKKMQENNIDITNTNYMKKYDDIALEFCKLHDNNYSFKDDIDGVIDWEKLREKIIDSLKIISN